MTFELKPLSFMILIKHVALLSGRHSDVGLHVAVRMYIIIK